MKLHLQKFLFVVAFLTCTSQLFASENIIGTWNYEAVQAPPEYAKGKIIFTENAGKLSGVIKLGEYTIDLLNVKTSGNEVTFGTSIEGEYISVKLVFEGNAFTGTANSSQGEVKITGTKEGN